MGVMGTKIKRGRNESKILKFANLRSQTSCHALKKKRKGHTLNSRECTKMNWNSLICELQLKPSQILSSKQPNQH